MIANTWLRYGLLPLILLTAALGTACKRTTADPPKFFEVRGIMHCHSNYSDGSGSIDEIAKAANGAGLDYVIVTDHDNLRALKENKEGWKGSTLTLISQETTTPAGHLLTFRVPPSFSVKSVTATQAILDKVKTVGGFGVLAHPINSHYPWKDWNVTGYEGLEIVNLMEKVEEQKSAIESMAMDMMMQGSIDYDKIFRLALSTYPKAQLERWDQMTAKRKLAMTGGSDAHARFDMNGMVMNIPPYEDTFRVMQMHLLLPEALNKSIDHDKALVYKAIEQGNGFIGYDVLGDSKGFRFFAVGSDKTASMGDSLPFARGIRFAVIAPKLNGVAPEKITLRILRNSAELARADGNGLALEADRPGVYRAEAWIGKGNEARLWILSNPIYLDRAE